MGWKSKKAKKCVPPLRPRKRISSQLLPVIFVMNISYLPLHHWAYDELDKFSTAGYLQSEYFNSKPFTRSEVVEIISKLNRADLTGRPALEWSLDRLNKEFHREAGDDSSQVWMNIGYEIQNKAYTDIENDDQLTNRVMTGVSGSLSYKNRMGLYERLLFDQEPAYDPDYLGKKWRSWTGESIGYVIFDASPFLISFGRLERFWGPGRYGSLILSDNSPRFDMLEMSMKWRWFKIEVFNAKLDPYGNENRYLSGHRFALKLKGIEIALSEVVLYGGENRGFELYYLNPLTFYHFGQLNRTNMNDNTMASLDASVILLPGYQLYGTAYVDDYQLEGGLSGSEGEPNEVGFLVGIHAVEPIPRLSGRAEYTQVKKWTYNQMLGRNRYTHRNKLIGHGLGPDADNLHLNAEYDLAPEYRVYADYDLTRHGEGTVYDEWTLGGGKKYEPEPFPSGIVETTQQFGLAFQYNRIAHPTPKAGLDLAAKVSAMYNHTRNKDHVGGKSASGFALEVVLRAELDWSGTP